MLHLVRHGRPLVVPGVPAAGWDLDPASYDVVLVGHGTAWTLVVADLTGAPPDLGRWAALSMPDVIRLP